MQAFTFQTGMDNPPCMAVPPSVLVVQGPEDIPVDIIANGAHIRVESTIFLRTLPGNLMELVTVLGRAVINPGTPDEMPIPAGSRITAPLGPDGLLAGVWDGWRLLQQEEIDLFGPLENLPANILQYPYVGPVIIIASGVGSPRPVVQTPHGTITPIPPPRRTFPRILMTGGPGEDVPRDPWTSLSVGDALCLDWMLFQSNADGDWDVYRLDRDGEVRNVSLGPGSSDVQASYSADGQWIAWVSNRDGLSNWEIWVAGADGSQPRRVTFNTAADINPVWGPGSEIVFESNRDGNWELYLLDVAGDGVPVRLTDDPGNDINAYWTPDGSAVYFQTDRDGNWEIYRLDFDDDMLGGTLTPITNNNLEDQMPVVSHDGTLLAWLQQDDFGFYNLMLMTLATQEVRQMTDTGSDIGGVVFAPDDSFLAFHTNLDGDYDVYAVEVASGAIKDVTASPGEDRAPAFVCGSPLIIFQSDRNAGPEYPGEHELFQTNPLPFTALPGPANLLTDGPQSDELFPNGMDREERNTRAGQIPAHRFQ
jgi:Tol biopolymer transport system component